MKLRMNHFVAFISLPIIITLLGGVYGRILVKQRPILTSMTQNGQEYDCIDFYKQPAFDHPSLKHLVPKVRPNSTTSTQMKFNDLDGGCPEGTIPISILIGLGPLPPPPPIRTEVHCYATVRTNTNKKFYGSDAQTSLYKPRAQGNQWSTSRIKLMNGVDSIEAGWMVFPEYFKDDDAHLYVRFNAGPTECLNLNCPGFVQVSPNFTLGGMPRDYSIIGREQFIWQLSIVKNKEDGHWWLSMTFDSAGTQQIGYWPNSLFTDLKDHATQVEWGGEINDPGATKPGPEMGSGLKAEYDQSQSAFFQEITTLDENYNKYIPDGTEKFYDCRDLYTALDWGTKGDYGRIIFYGGAAPRD